MLFSLQSTCCHGALITGRSKWFCLFELHSLHLRDSILLHVSLNLLLTTQGKARVSCGYICFDFSEWSHPKATLKSLPHFSLALSFDRMEFPFLRVRRWQMGEGGGSKQTEKYCTRHMLNLSTEQDFFTTVLKKIKVPASLLNKFTEPYNSIQAFFYFRVSRIYLGWILPCS